MIYIHVQCVYCCVYECFRIGAGDLLASYEWELQCSKKADQRRLRQVHTNILYPSHYYLCVCVCVCGEGAEYRGGARGLPGTRSSPWQPPTVSLHPSLPP